MQYFLGAHGHEDRSQLELPNEVISGPIVQSVTSLNVDPGILSLIQAQSHTFMEIDQDFFSMFNLLLSLIQEGLMSVTRESITRCTG